MNLKLRRASSFATSLKKPHNDSFSHRIFRHISELCERGELNVALEQLEKEVLPRSKNFSKAIQPILHLARKKNDYNVMQRVSRMFEKHNLPRQDHLMNEYIINKTCLKPESADVSLISTQFYANNTRNCTNNLNLQKHSLLSIANEVNSDVNRMTLFHRCLVHQNNFDMALSIFPKVAFLRNGSMITVLQKYFTNKFPRNSLLMTLVLFQFVKHAGRFYMIDKSHIGWLLESVKLQCRSSSDNFQFFVDTLKKFESSSNDSSANFDKILEDSLRQLAKNSAYPNTSSTDFLENQDESLNNNYVAIAAGIESKNNYSELWKWTNCFNERGGEFNARLKLIGGLRSLINWSLITNSNRMCHEILARLCLVYKPNYSVLMNTINSYPDLKHNVWLLNSLIKQAAIDQDVQAFQSILNHIVRNDLPFNSGVIDAIIIVASHNQHNLGRLLEILIDNRYFFSQRQVFSVLNCFRMLGGESLDDQYIDIEKKLLSYLIDTNYVISGRLKRFFTSNYLDTKLLGQYEYSPTLNMSFILPDELVYGRKLEDCSYSNKNAWILPVNDVNCIVKN
ncbi:MAG: hypothetical protein MHMPM18_001179 [Marteilia pararefringens]